MSTASQLRRRSQLLGTQAFTRGTVKRLGLVTQVWVDPQSLEVAGFEIRGSSKQSAIASVPFSQVTLLGTGAVLVEPSALSDPLNTAKLAKLVGRPLATADGVALGKIKGFEFDAESGEIARLRLSATGLPLLPTTLETTFNIDRADLVAGETLAAVEGAQQRVSLVKRGLLERVGFGKFAWADELMEAGISIVPRPTLESETPEPETPESETEGEVAEATVTVAKPDEAKTISSEVQAVAAPIESEPTIEPGSDIEFEPTIESEPTIVSDLAAEPESEIESHLDGEAIAATAPAKIEPAKAHKTAPRPHKPLSHPPLPPGRSISLPSSASRPPQAGGFQEVRVKGR